MREILFKGKRVDNGEWVDGCYMTDEQDPTTAYIGHIFGMDGGVFVHDMDIVPVEPETVCQYTGLTDKNGRKIFEGDIVKIPGHKNHNVKFGYGQFFIGINCPIAYERDNCEVIGNIFDNPELVRDDA